MRRGTPKIVFVLKFIAFAVVFVVAIGFIVSTLWNWLIPELFHGPVISFWQAVGLFVLGKIIFGWHGSGKPGWAGRRDWRRKMQAHMESMTPEEREKLRERLKKCQRRPFDYWMNKEEVKEQEKGSETI